MIKPKGARKGNYKLQEKQKAVLERKVNYGTFPGSVVNSSQSQYVHLVH
jgi:hypothetical protein